VAAPALNSRLPYLFADVDHARELAGQRLAGSIETLRANGIEARGAVGDQSPVQAIEDVLFEFDADEIVISTHPPSGPTGSKEDGRTGTGAVRPADDARRGRPPP